MGYKTQSTLLETVSNEVERALLAEFRLLTSEGKMDFCRKAERLILEHPELRANAESDNQGGNDMNENELLSFWDGRFGKIRALLIDGEPWFVGKDLATALGYSNASKAVMVHVDADDKRFEMLRVSDSQNGNLVKTALINESGFYSLAFGSKMKEAKAFKRWVTHEVLPAIRKRGAYLTDDAKRRAADEIRSVVREEIRAALKSTQKAATPAVSPNNLAALIETTRRIMVDIGCPARDIGKMACDNYAAFGVAVPQSLANASYGLPLNLIDFL